MVDNSVKVASLLDMIEEESKTAGPKVSIYFSVPHASDYAILGHATLKGHIRAVRMRLGTMKIPEEQKWRILERLEFVQDSIELWSHRSESYVIFASPEVTRYYALPVPLGESVWIGEDYHIIPLVKFLSIPEYFYLLEISHGSPQLFRVHSQFSTLVPVMEKVRQLESSWRTEELVHDRSFHTAGTYGAGHTTHGGPIPHGNGSDTESLHRDLFLKLLATTVDDVLAGEHALLVLAGSESMVAHFRTYLKYPSILVSPERLSMPIGRPTTLDAEAWQYCLRLYNENTLPPISESQFGKLRSEGRVIEEVSEILSLSALGGIEMLLIGEAPIAAPDAEYLDLLNAAVAMTMKHHGQVIQTSRTALSHGVAAIARQGFTTLETFDTLGHHLTIEHL